MKRFAILVLSLMFALSVSACESKKDGGDEKKEEKAGGEEGGEGAAEGGGEEGGGEEGATEGGGEEGGTSMQAIEKFGLKAELPEGAQISDGVGGDGVMIQAPGLVVGIDPPSDFTPADMEAAKKDAAESYSGTDFKEEALDDGWALTWVNEGGMGKNYWVQVRRTVGDTEVWCTTTASQPEQQTNALAVCKSLTQ